MLPELPEGSNGGDVKTTAAVGMLLWGKAQLKDAIKDIEAKEDDDVYLSLQGYIIKPDPIKALPFNKKLVIIMLEAQIEVYQYLINEIQK